MKYVRPLVRVTAVLAAILVVALIVAVVVSQTAWFRDWIRRYAMREAEQVVNGQLFIGRVDGGLWNGVQLHDVRVEQEGMTVVSVESILVDYRVLDFIRQGVVIRRVDLVGPHINLRREGDTWNVANLMVETDEPRDPDAALPQFRVDEIELVNGSVSIDDPDCPAGTPGCLPARVDNLVASARVASTADGLDVTLQNASLETSEPDLTVQRLALDLRSTDTDIDVRSMELVTGASRLTGSARIANYATAPDVRVDLSADPLTLEEVARFVPQLEGTTLAPVIGVTAEGPLDAVRVELDVASEAGTVRGSFVADAAEPVYGLNGTIAVERLDAGAIMMDPALTSRITATADVNVTGADVASLSGDVALRATDLQGMGYQAEALDARARLREGVADIIAAVSAYGAHVSTEGRVVYGGFDEGALSYDLTGQVRNVNLRRLPATLGAPAMATNVSLDYRAAGDLDRTRATAEFARSTIGDAVLAPGTVIGVTLGDEQLAYTAKGSVSGLDLQQLGQALDVEALNDPLYQSNLNATFDVAGRGMDLPTTVATARLDLAPSSVGEARIPALHVDARIDRQAVEVSAAGRVENVRPELFTGRDDLAGVVAGRFDVNASIPDATADLDVERMTLDARLELDPTDIGGVALSEVRADVQLTEGVGEVRELLVVSPAVELRASGPVALHAAGDTRLQYDLHVKDAGTLAALADVDGVAGTLRTEGVLTGSLQQLAVDGQLSADNVIYAETGSVEAVRGTYQATVRDLDVETAVARVDATATRAVTGETVIDEVALTAAYEANQVDFNADVRQDDLTLGLGGLLELQDAGQDVRLRRLEAAGQGLSWALAPGAEPHITHADGTLSVADLRLQSGEQQLVVEGVIDLPTEERELSARDLTVQATAVDLGAIGRSVAPEREIEGRLDASIEASGNLETGRASGTLSVTDGAVQGYRFASLDARADYGDGVADVDLRLQQDATASLTVAGRVPVAAFLEDEAPGTAARADRLDLTVTSTPIDLAVLEGVTDMVDQVQGTVQLNARVQGTASRPLVDGALTLAGGAFRVPLVDARYEGLEADVRFASDLITVQTFRLRDRNGNPFELNGTVALAETTVTDVKLKATANEFRLLDNRLGDVRMTADLDVSGNMAAPVIQGTISIPNSRIEVDRMMAALAALGQDETRDDVNLVYEPEALPAQLVLEGAEAPELGPGDIPIELEEPSVLAIGPLVPREAAEDVSAVVEDTPGMLDAATIDVRLTVPNDLVLRGDDIRAGADGPSVGAMNLTVGADLRAAQKPGEPLIVTGAINTVRGHYDFQGRRFLVERDGAIRFDGAEVTNPSLNITAVRNISGVEARINVRGTAEQPELVLSSVPSLDQGDILALIIFDRPLDDLGQGEQVSLARQAGELVGGRLTGALATSLRDVLNVDLFEIDAFDERGPAVTVGDRIGDRLFIRFRQQVGGQDTSQVLLEYELLRNLRLQTMVTQGAQTDRSPGQRVERSGIDLLYFFYY